MFGARQAVQKGHSRDTHSYGRNIYINEYEHEMKVGKIERKLGEVILTQSSTTVLIPAWDHLVGLVYMVGIKLKHR